MLVRRGTTRQGHHYSLRGRLGIFLAVGFVSGEICTTGIQ